MNPRKRSLSSLVLKVPAAGRQDGQAHRRTWAGLTARADQVHSGLTLAHGTILDRRSFDRSEPKLFRSLFQKVSPLSIAPPPIGTAPGAAPTAGPDAGPDDHGATQPATAASNWIAPAWEDIVRDHGDRVYRLAYRLAGNSHDAEDITQETFIRVFRSLHSFRPGSFEGWLHRITTNVFLDMVRRRQRIRMEALPEETDRIAGREPSPEQAFQDANLDPDLQAALDELLPEFRAAVVLCDVEGLSYEEIGATLGVKLGTVRSRIHRGRQALRASIERRREARAEGGSYRNIRSALSPKVVMP